MILLFALYCWRASATAVVDTTTFAPGHSWTWVYSALDKGVWSPYFQETYTVADRTDAKVTVLMQSSELGKPLSDPHHKFVVDIKNCERQARDPRFRAWTVVFYTRNLGAGKWTLVSTAHPNLVFTEKFNCAGDGPPVEAGTTDDGEPIFQFAPRIGQDSTWYFDTGAIHRGVSARKVFAPAYTYRAEFTRAD